MSHVRSAEKPEGHTNDIHPKIVVRLEKDGVRCVDECSALIDPGSELCPIRQGVLPEIFYQPSVNHLQLTAVKNQSLAGGDKEVLITIVIPLIDKTDKKAFEMRIPTWMHSADIRENIMLSYEWCEFRGGYLRQKARIALPQIRPGILGLRCAYHSSRKTRYSCPCCGGILALALHISIHEVHDIIPGIVVT